MAEDQNEQNGDDTVRRPSISAATRAAWLDAMGVDLWVRRDRPSQVVETAEHLPTEAGAQSASTQHAPVEPAPAPAAVDEMTPGPAPTTPEEPAPEPVRQEVTVDDAELPALARMVSDCTRCSLSTTRSNTVFGVGNPNADWMFVGEAPGREEDRRGEPFVGRAGQLLDSILFAIGLERDDVYIANVLKCRPPDNRDPMGEEVVQCEPYLHRQIALVQPRIIIAMGRFAAQSLLRSTDAIGRLRGQQHSWRESGIPLVVTYHPAYLLRSPEQKSKVWEDLVFARKIVDPS